VGRLTDALEKPRVTPGRSKNKFEKISGFSLLQVSVSVKAVVPELDHPLRQGRCKWEKLLTEVE